ncbi:MAG: hypothetical protein ACOY4H_06530 [Thermodesulfobacteriota bacterium]
MRTPRIVLFTLLTCILSTSSSRGDEPQFTWGGDIRARIVDFHRIPTEKGGMPPENRFLRVRSRLQGAYRFTPDVAFQARLTNEWREYDSDKGRNDYQAMDEFIVDNFFLDAGKLCGGRLDLRIGRQDLRYGTGKIISEGTPLDSSRAYYFNAIKARITLSPQLLIDLLGIANANEDEFAIHRENRELFEGDENGGGIYVINNRTAALRQEYYYIFKHEVRQSSLDLHTWGMRFTPRFSAALSANLELALQDGNRDNGNNVDSQLLDLSLFYALPLRQSRRPVVELSYYFLSGDDPDSSTEEGWHPVWARAPHYLSYIIPRALMPDFASWSNLSMPSIGLSSAVTDNLSCQLRLAKVYASEKGLDGGTEKGTLFISRFTYTINKKWDGALHVEVMDPDSYYRTVNHYAHYAHLELMYHF